MLLEKRKEKEMVDKLLFKEIETISDIASYSNGMFVIGCKNKFTEEQVTSVFQSAAQPDFADLCNSTFFGVLLPYFLHNINNKLVGVLGNIDLATMFIPNLDKVQIKLDSARHSTTSVIDYLRDISGSIEQNEQSSFGEAAFNECLELLKLACGRSVNIEGFEEIRLEKPINCLDSARAVSSLKGLAAWLIVSLGGSGKISVRVNKNNITMKWNKPEGGGLAHMPGSEQGSFILLLAGGLAVSAGFSFVVSKWTEKEGEVTIVT